MRTLFYKNIRKTILGLVGSLALINYASAQDDCASAITVTDLTGAVCATSAPSATNFLGAGGCEEGTFDTWFQFTAQGTSADFTVSNNGVGGWRPEYLIVSGTPASTCAGFGLLDCVDLNGNYTSISGTTVGLNIGETYWIVVSSNGNNTSGTISVCVDNPVTAAGCVDNQDCGTPAPMALNAPGGGPACVTDCNNGASPGPDFAGTNCFDLPNATVWYQITTDATTTTIDIDLSSTDLSDPEFTLFSTADCLSFTIEDCVEGSGGNASSLGINVSASTTYLVAVSDVTADEGNFDLCITQNAAPVGSCVDNQDCASPAPLPLNPTGGGAACVVDCNTGASAGPDFTGNNCQDLPNETVWYEFTTAADVATLDVTLTSGDLSDPEFTIFTTADCALGFTTIHCEEGTAGSASTSGLGITASTTYLIGVSDVTGDVGNFNLCITQNADNSACNVDNALTVTATSLGSPLGGPYQPGEVVSFCYTINNYITGLPAEPQGCNYLAGLVPSFGNCWDPVSFDAQGMPTALTTPPATIGVIPNCPPGPPCFYNACSGDPAGTWSWFPDGAVQYNLASANPLGLTTGDNVGSGWFFLSSYASPEGTCSTPESDPNSSYGDNDFPQCNNLNGWTVCFDLRAKTFAAACGGSGETNCSVSMKTFADGEIGVWNNIGCTADVPTTSAGDLACVLLSTDLKEFSGKNQGNKNLLFWEILNNPEIVHFVLEKSVDGISWNALETINKKENSTTYSYLDGSPYQSVTYYRLQVVDLAGVVRFSEIISVSSTKELGTGLVSEPYPNPAQDRIYLTYTGGNFAEPVEIKVVNVMGQVIDTRSVEMTNINEILTIETTTITEGVYYISISQGTLKTVKRISIIR